MFDSQNNNKGGYNVGEKSERANSLEVNQYNMKYFMSGPIGNVANAGATHLDIEWTNQHGCGDGDLNCQIILQYMCEEHKEEQIGSNTVVNRKRNGERESINPYRPHRPFVNKVQKDNEERLHASHRVYGLNEPWSWYDKCTKRHRNHGLFVADQKLKSHASIYTRQNPNGNRYGYECPEERDYYPYWHPTDWIDIAVLVDKKADCAYYNTESFNVKPKGECMQKYPAQTRYYKHDSIYNNKFDCESHGGEWINYYNYLEEASEHTNLADCEQAKYKWVFAYRSDKFDKDENSIKRKCVVPLKAPECLEAPYSRSNHLGNGAGITPLTYRWKLPHFPSKKPQRCFLRIRYNISTNDPKDKIKTDPTVKLLNKLPLQLAINTAQFGRTFQDRSHMFILEHRKNVIPYDLNIYNVNIRGKRGNIVQVYPAVEYDFVPKRLNITSKDAVSLQWTGSNHNPTGNDGEGDRGTDKNNFVQMNYAPYSLPVPFSSDMLKSAQVIHNSAGGSKIYKDIEASLASSGYYRTAQEKVQKSSNPRFKLNGQLNNASPSFPGMILKWANAATYYYMCTRNNNFTNRSQKGRLIIKNQSG